MTEPPPGRPYMPGYGLLKADQGSGLLPWSWAEELLIAPRNYWLVSVWPYGRLPVWGLWDEGAFWFSSSNGSRKGATSPAIRAASCHAHSADKEVRAPPAPVVPPSELDPGRAQLARSGPSVYRPAGCQSAGPAAKALAAHRNIGWRRRSETRRAEARRGRAVWGGDATP